MARTRRKNWSYNEGEKGRNWVRVFEKSGRPSLQMEWREDGKRRSMSLGHADRRRAKRQASELADRFEGMDGATRTPITLAKLFRVYLSEVTPTKAATTQKHDQRALGRFLDHFGDVRAETLDRRLYDRYVQHRRKGKLHGFGPVGNRAVEQDVRLLMAVFNWGTVAGENGQAYLPRNPWKGFPVPKNKSPTRVAMTPEEYESLRGNAPCWRFEVALVMGWETGRRNSSIRQLRWSDIDMGKETATWRGATDKAGRETVTPLSDSAQAVLKLALKEREGSEWVLHAPKDPNRPCTKYYFGLLMSRAKRHAGIERKYLGWHSLKRSFVRRHKQLPTKILERMTGTSYITLNRVYDEASVDDMRDAMELLRAGN